MERHLCDSQMLKLKATPKVIICIKMKCIQKATPKAIICIKMWKTNVTILKAIREE